MKKNNLYKIVKNSGSGLGFVLLVCVSQNISAQSAVAKRAALPDPEQNVFSNDSVVMVTKGTILSIYKDYENKPNGKFVNDGSVYIFENWKNDGEVTYSPSEEGKTFFTGEKGLVYTTKTEKQLITGANVSEFQNVLFRNETSAVPFNLEGIISVAKKAEFLQGVVNADKENDEGLVIFKENAFHTNTSDKSFVDGNVEKQGSKAFEFPVGDVVGDVAVFRPSFHAAGPGENIYTTKYFYKNSDVQYDHTKKEPTIGLINDQEYWEVAQEAGSDKIVLSLTMRDKTTPSEFLNPSIDKQVAIVRWDKTQNKWVREGGVVSNAASGEPYTYLLTSQVSGYGIFTMALVDKVAPDPDDLIVYNGISPNGDGKNDSFLIKGIDKYPDNEVEIYNRWGVKVYDAKSYNESDVMFRGYSDGRATVNRGEKLPTGTYFYILKYNNGKKGIEKSGYLYINNQ